MQNFSVLMSVYAGENPIYLAQCLQSLTGQSVQPAEVVIVKDGPLTAALEEVLQQWNADYPGLFVFVSLAKNVGLGAALQAGLAHCRCELVARMDSDDISEPQRFQLQLEAFSQTKELALVGGQIGEFADDPDIITTQRIVPLAFQDIKIFSIKRNPFNHVTVMFRKAAVLQAGGYQSMPLFEDYWLWMRMLAAGFLMRNLPQLLVRVRVGNGMMGRRGGLQYIPKVYRFQKSLLQQKYITTGQFAYNVSVRTAACFLPSGWRKMVYQKYLRKPER